MINDANGVIPNRVVINCYHPDILKEIEDSWPSELTAKRFSEKVYHFLFPEKSICENGKHKSFESYNKGYYFCAKQCECALKQKKDTMVARYGVEHPLQSEEIKNKLKDTLISRYGVETVSQVNPTQRADTNLKKYGTASPLGSKTIKDKIAKTNLEKYQADTPFGNKEIQKKCISSIQEKYGVRNVLMLDENKQKAKQANIEKYGSTSSFSSPVVQEKRIQTLIQKYGVEHQSQIHHNKELLDQYHNDEKFIEIYNSYDYVSEIADYFELKKSSIHKKANSLGLPTKYNTISKEEQSIVDFLSQFTTVQQSNRTLISPKEIDIWLPEYNIGIEYNGLYYHNISRDNISVDYHLNKTKSMEQLGYRLIHIFSDEWIHKQEIVKSRLLNIIKQSTNRVYARKTKIVELTSQEASHFLEQNHIQGGCASRHRYGLVYNGVLVSVMTFGKPRFNKNYDWELIRFANLINYTVVGGAGKLLKHFINTYGSSVISYADRRWSDGNLYDKIGFSCIGNSKPNYFYIDKDTRISRYKSQKHKLKDQLEIFDPDSSEYINMKNNGFTRIYDCGNSIWVYNKK